MSWYIIIGLSQIRPLKIRQLREHDGAITTLLYSYLIPFVDAQPVGKILGYAEM